MDRSWVARRYIDGSSMDHRDYHINILYYFTPRLDTAVMVIVWIRCMNIASIWGAMGPSPPKKNNNTKIVVDNQRHFYGARDLGYSPEIFNQNIEECNRLLKQAFLYV